ncbi:NR LBD domain-containing protein [Caenorhabditis elegans]|uniref:NR LBD domain-containing protein n=1 Tax=Caenorhabditis elegans TaxID=6239 RepID=Q9NAJ2_CAEEL|nr:NR LBD domain-containing protein [Caenorhabditis elegans]CAB54410.1 NR LBD domain-containing protein [Caenorhabditis elegans]|eukprot:NP_496702.1 Nuclear Hormone Receptor family [Caenorhabditis elegans]
MSNSDEQILQFYVEHFEKALEKTQNVLLEFAESPLNHLKPTKRATDAQAFQFNSTCPGVENLNKLEREALFQQSSFVNLWLNLAYTCSKSSLSFWDSRDQGSEGGKLEVFMPRLHDSLTTEFHRIHLDPQEFATICAITTWKIHQWGTVEANTVAGQHYLAVIKELNNHHKKTTTMRDFERALRITEIISLLVPIGRMLQEVKTLYETLGIKDDGRE